MAFCLRVMVIRRGKDPLLGIGGVGKDLRESIWGFSSLLKVAL